MRITDTSNFKYAAEKPSSEVSNYHIRADGSGLKITILNTVTLQQQFDLIDWIKSSLGNTQPVTYSVTDYDAAMFSMALDVDNLNFTEFATNFDLFIK